MIKAFLLHGAKDNLYHKNQTPLLLALERHNYEMAKLLLETDAFYFISNQFLPLF